MQSNARTYRHYYFPGGAKHIPYSQIRQVRQVTMRSLGWRTKMWGSSDLIHWALPHGEQERTRAPQPCQEIPVEQMSAGVLARMRPDLAIGAALPCRAVTSG